MNRLDARRDHPAIVSLADGEGVVISAGGYGYLTMIPAGGGTVTYSKVDEVNASAHDAGSATTATELSLAVQWPFYRVSVAGGTARIAAG